MKNNKEVSYNTFIKETCKKVSLEWINKSKELYKKEALKLGYVLSDLKAIELATESYNEMLANISL